MRGTAVGFPSRTWGFTYERSLYYNQSSEHAARKLGTMLKNYARDGFRFPRNMQGPRLVARRILPQVSKSWFSLLGTHLGKPRSLGVKTSLGTEAVLGVKPFLAHEPHGVETADECVEEKHRVFRLLFPMLTTSRFRKCRPIVFFKVEAQKLSLTVAQWLGLLSRFSQ
jgi:hypothetical protein